MLMDTRHTREWMEIHVLTWRLMDIGSGIMQRGCCYYLSLAKVIHVLIVPSSLWAAPTFNLRPLVPFDNEIVIGRDIGIGWWRKCFMTIISPAPDGSWGRLAKLKYFPLTDMVLWFGYTCNVVVSFIFGFWFRWFLIFFLLLLPLPWSTRRSSSSPLQPPLSSPRPWRYFSEHQVISFAILLENTWMVL